MHVVVLGAGVIGVSSAYYLAEQGCDVTLVDRAKEPASGTSHGNGGQLAYSFVDALAQPSLLADIPRLLLGLDPAMRVKLLGRPSMLGWGLSFLGQCTQSRARANTLAVLKLAQQSSECLAELRVATGIEFSYARMGKVMLLPEGADLDAARRSIEFKKEHGCVSELLALGEVHKRFPELQKFPLSYAAALHAPNDEVGDARAFTTKLAGWLQHNRSVDCRFGVAVSAIDVQGGRAVGVRTDAGKIAADAVLVCLGTQSPDLLRPLGLRTPIYPLRGYSVTLPPGPAAPKVSVTDMQRRIVFSMLNGQVRVAGMADFVGNDHSRDKSRIDVLLKMAREIAPDYADYDADDISPWAGDRPMTPNGRPLLGRTSIPALYLNCGHGMLGWTLAASTALRVAKAIADKQ